MTCLSDRDIKNAIDRGDLDITPRPLGDTIQPASVDLTLANDFLIPKPEQVVSFVTDKRPKPIFERLEGPSVWLEPGAFILCRTHETVSIGPKFRARVEGKSTIGRCGLMVHVTAGYIDPGFRGTITLELVNMAPYAIEISAGQRICQLSIDVMSSKPDFTYGSAGLGSHYQDQKETTAPR
jgi:dCTP deaminase